MTAPDTDFPACSAYMRDCTLCPRNCHANRLAGRPGICGQTAEIRAARAALHFWEEPCISGSRGSGAVFFSGCNLGCVYCQNFSISQNSSAQGSLSPEQKDRIISPERLAEIFLELQEKGAHNINLVTPTHFIPQIVHALRSAKLQGLSIPIVYNTGSYEKPESLLLLEGLVDIYLPDLKYYSPELALRYSHAADYFDTACAAIAEMYRQTGSPSFADNGEHSCDMPLMKKGVIVRHLLLPGQTKDSKKILRYLHETYGDHIYISILNQYTPLPHTAEFPDLNRPVSGEEYARVLRFAERIGICNGFIQEGAAAGEDFIPEFDGTGL